MGTDMHAYLYKKIYVFTICKWFVQTSQYTVRMWVPNKKGFMFDP